MRGLKSRVADRFFPRHIPASRRPESSLDYPDLGPRDVENAKLFARREDLVEYVAPQLRGGTVAEIGVMYGDFSDFIIRTLEPELFVAIDIFRMHTVACTFKGKPSAETFQGLTHREYYEKRFSDRSKQVRCEEGDSSEVLPRYADGTFHMIYIDAGHDYESVKKDADLSTKKLKPNGILIFNDYIRYSHMDDSYYGVVPVVNELVVNKGFKVVGFALEGNMYCDIAIRLPTTS